MKLQIEKTVSVGAGEENVGVGALQIERDSCFRTGVRAMEGHRRLFPSAILRAVLLGCVGIGLVAAAPAALAQSTSAGIGGTVTDSTGAVVPGATLVLKNTDTSIEQRAQTSASGTYSIINILPGNYAIHVTKSGFGSVDQPNVTLQVNQTATLNFQMIVGNSTQTVTVSSQVSTVESSTAELGTVITQRPVKQLPLNGRNFTQLLTLTPGVSPVSVGQNNAGGGGFAGSALGTFTFPSVNGQRNRSNMFLLDGVHDLAFIGNYNYSPIIDDIQEFKVQSHNDLAEFGEVTGGIINVATKGGTNAFHGDVWEFLRNEKLDARNYFLSQRNPLRQNQFGVAVGGPVLLPHIYNGHDKTFFFFAYEGFRQSQSNQSTVLTPTDAQLGGDFSALLAGSKPVRIYDPQSTRPDPANPGQFLRDAFPGNIIPMNRLSSAALLYSTLFPKPQGNVGGGNNVVNNTPSLVTSNSYTGRLDQNFGTHDVLFGRVSYVDQPSSSSNGYPGVISSVSLESWNIAVRETHVFNPTTILDLHFGRNLGNDVNQVVFTSAPDGFVNSLINAGFASKYLTGFTATKSPLIPQVSISGYVSTTLGGNNLQATQIANTYQFGGDFTKILGRHTLKFGADYSSNNFYGPLAGASEGTSAFQTSNLEQPTDPATGAQTGDAFASFLLGVPNASQRRDAIEEEHGGSIDGGYAQDQFKVTPSLSLNFGVRYDVSLWPAYGNLGNGQGYVGNLDLTNGQYIIAAQPPACSATLGAPCIPGGTLPAGVLVTPNGNRGLHNTDYGNWQGRVGVAYRVSPRISLRAGYSRFYDEWNGVAQFAQNVGGNWPSVGLLNINQQNNTLPTSNVGDPLNLGSGALTYPPATPFGNATFYFNPNMKTPYADQWNLGLDQQVSPSTTLSLAYVGSHGGRLDLGGIKNTARFPGPGDAATVASRREFPNITATNYDDSTGNSNYHALQTRLSRSTSNGLTYLLSYTWSKSIDLASSGDFGSEGTELQDPYNPRLDRSVSGFDLTHIFSGSVVYELPFGKNKMFNPSNSVASYLAGGWQVNAIVNLNSGKPYDVIYNGDNANTGNTFVRANIIGNPYATTRIPDPANPRQVQDLNPASFSTPPLYSFGTSGRNSLRTDWNRNLDLSLFRNFPLKELATLEFRAEAFNLTNTVVFAQPNSTINAPNFGVVNATANTPRQIQFALKLIF